MTSLVNCVKGWIDRVQAENTLAQMSQRDVADLGLSRADLRDVLDLPSDTAGRMERVAVAYDVSGWQAKAGRVQALEMIRVCGHCDQRDKCRRALQDAAPKTMATFDFCPNQHAYRTIASRPA